MKPKTPKQYSDSEVNFVVIAFKKKFKLTYIQLQDYIGLTEKHIVLKLKGKNKWKLSEKYLIMNFLKRKL